jgi:non-ribosomal peptide synthetase component F
LVLRTDLSGDPTFRELVQRVRAVSLGAYKYQDFPFEKLVDELKPERDPSLTPLFQVLFSFEQVTQEEIKLNGLQITLGAAGNESGKFDLSLGIADSIEGLDVGLEYNPDLFNAGTAERLVGCFETLLTSIAENPDWRISQFALLSPAESSQLLQQWNQTSVSFPARCVHKLYEEQVERRPLATALVFENRQFSYRELNARANRLGHYLRGFGVGPEVLVGICVERSVEMIVGVLGVLKAGGAFVPIDPKHPQERIDFIIDDARLSILLTQRHLTVGAARHPNSCTTRGHGVPPLQIIPARSWASFTWILIGLRLRNAPRKIRRRRSISITSRTPFTHQARRGGPRACCCTIAD